MLSRTADHLFWMSRYTERAENTARMLDVNYQTSLLPQSEAVALVGWQGLLSISELLPTYQSLHGEVNVQKVMDFMVKDESNPSSIMSCLSAARENARAVRGTLTTEVWETHNQTWLEVRRMVSNGGFEQDPGQFFEWVKFRSHLSRGVTLGTMLMDEALHFMLYGQNIHPSQFPAQNYSPVWSKDQKHSGLKGSLASGWLASGPVEGQG